MPRLKRRLAATVNLAADLDTLPDLPLERLKMRWQELYGRPPPARLGRKLMVRGIAYRLQEQALGGLGSATRRKLAGIADAIAAGNEPVTARPSIKPGTRLLREWQRQVHEAIIEDNGVRYAGKVWPSLSAVAREITGSRWSGPRFFGLTDKRHAGA